MALARVVDVDIHPDIRVHKKKEKAERRDGAFSVNLVCRGPPGSGFCRVLPRSCTVVRPPPAQGNDRWHFLVMPSITQDILWLITTHGAAVAACGILIFVTPKRPLFSIEAAILMLTTNEWTGEEIPKSSSSSCCATPQCTSRHAKSKAYYIHYILYMYFFVSLGRFVSIDGRGCHRQNAIRSRACLHHSLPGRERRAKIITARGAQ